MNESEIAVRLYRAICQELGVDRLTDGQIERLVACIAAHGRF